MLRERWGGASEEIFLQIEEGQTCYIPMQAGEGHSFVWRGKNPPCRLVGSYLLTNTRSVEKPKTCTYKQS